VCHIVNWLADDHVNGDFVSYTDDNGSWKNGRQLLRQYVFTSRWPYAGILF